MTIRSTLAAALAVVAAPALAFALSVGDEMPQIPLKDAKLHDVDGRDITLKDVAGAKGTLVVFTCNHCPYAKAWEDRLVALGNDYAKKGVGVVAINSNDPSSAAEDSFEEMQKRAKEKSYGFPYVVDSTSGVAKAFGAQKTPEVFLFDAGSKLAYHGAIDDNSEDAKAVKEHYLHDALEALLAGKAASPAETKALGCGIKFRDSTT